MNHRQLSIKNMQSKVWVVLVIYYTSKCFSVFVGACASPERAYNLYTGQKKLRKKLKKTIRRQNN